MEDWVCAEMIYLLTASDLSEFSNHLIVNRLGVELMNFWSLCHEATRCEVVKSQCCVIDEGTGDPSSVPRGRQHSEQAVQAAEGTAVDTDVQGRSEGSACQVEGGAGSASVYAQWPVRTEHLWSQAAPACEYAYTAVAIRQFLSLLLKKTEAFKHQQQLLIELYMINSLFSTSL